MNALEDFTCFKKIGAKKTLAATDNKTGIKDCLWYCDGLFKEYYEDIKEEN